MNDVRFGVLGTARIARTIVPRIHAVDGAVMHCVASRSSEKAREFAAEFDVPHVAESYESLIRDPEIDAVYVPLPPSMHEEWVEKLADAGKHVLCEKPLATSAAAARRMWDACQRNQVVLLDGVMWYHTQRAAAIRACVQSGTLGDVSQVTSAFTFPGQHLASDNLRLHRSLGGGALLDLGWYTVGVSLWLLDEMPVTVQAAAEFRNDVDIHMNAILQFASGRAAAFECGFTAARRRWLEVAGSRAALRCPDFTRPFDPASSAFHVIDSDGVTQETIVVEAPQEESMIRIFLGLIAAGKIDHPWIRLSLRTQQICDALDAAARQAAAVAVPDPIV